jgi:hypothetical protein
MRETADGLRVMMGWTDVDAEMSIGKSRDNVEVLKDEPKDSASVEVLTENSTTTVEAMMSKPMASEVMVVRAG